MAAAVANIQLSVHPFNLLGYREFSRSEQRPRLRSDRHRNPPATFDGVSFLGPLLCRRSRLRTRRCRSFRSENGGESSSERDGKVVPEETASQGLKRKGALYSLKSLLVRISGGREGPGGQYRKAIEKAEAIFFSQRKQDLRSIRVLCLSMPLSHISKGEKEEGFQDFVSPVYSEDTSRRGADKPEEYEESHLLGLRMDADLASKPTIHMIVDTDIMTLCFSSVAQGRSLEGLRVLH